MLDDYGILCLRNFILENLSLVLCYRMESSQLIYFWAFLWEPPLGLPVCGDVVGKILEKTCGVEDAIFSKDGRLTFDISTLSSLPIYFRSLFVNPNKADSKLEKIYRGFLWKVGALYKRSLLVKCVLKKEARGLWNL